MNPPSEANQPQGLQISNELWHQMRSEVERLAPEEACGLLCGKDSQILEVIPITNELHSRVRFRMKPEEQLRAFQHMDELGWELLGIYHSHPQGPDGPSTTDIAEAHYPETVYLIWSGANPEWQCRGFRIQDGAASPAPVRIIGHETLD